MSYMSALPTPPDTAHALLPMYGLPIVEVTGSGYAPSLEIRQAELDHDTRRLHRGVCRGPTLSPLREAQHQEERRRCRGRQPVPNAVRPRSFGRMRLRPF